MTKIRTTRPAARRAVYAPPPTSGSAVAIAVIGWIIAVGAGLGIVSSINTRNRLEARIRADFADKQQVADANLQAAKGEAEKSERQLRDKLQTLSSDLQTLTSQKRKLERGVAGLEKRLPVMRQQLAELEAAAAAQPERLPAADEELVDGALPPGFDPLGPPLPVGNRPAPPRAPAAPVVPVAANAGDRDPLLLERDILIKRIADAKTLLKLKFEQAVDDGRGPQLHAFYRAAAHTPYGAAALFFAAERYYEDGKLTQAAAAYRNCREQFPGSPYTEFIDQRIDQVMDKDRFRRSDATIQPYTNPE